MDGDRIWFTITRANHQRKPPFNLQHALLVNMAVEMTIIFNRTNRTFRCAFSRQPQGISSCKGPFLGSSREFAGGVYRNDWIIRVQSFLEWIQVIYITNVYIRSTWSTCIYFHILYCIRMYNNLLWSHDSKTLSDWNPWFTQPFFATKAHVQRDWSQPLESRRFFGSIGEIGRKRSIIICRYICETPSFSCFWCFVSES